MRFFLIFSISIINWNELVVIIHYITAFLRPNLNIIIALLGQKTLHWQLNKVISWYVQLQF